MKFITALLFGLTFLVGCDRLEGQLNVTKNITLKSSKGETRTINVGTYTADFRVSTLGKHLNLRLNNDTNELYKFKLPKGTKIPDNGTVKLNADQVGQNVDLVATVKTDYTDSPTVEGYESCTYSQDYTVCSPGPYGPFDCRIYSRVIVGTQWVRYYNRTTNQDFILSIAQAGSTLEAAQFLAQDTRSERIIKNRSLCR